MFKKALLFLLTAFTGSLFAYDKPNSIAYYPKANAYFISNLAGKSITCLDSNFTKTDVITGLTRPKDILFASFGPYNGLLILDSNEVKVYDADGYAFIAAFKVSGAMDLEDAEEDKTTNGTFYISDPMAHIIFKVVIGPAPFYIPTFSVLNSTIRNPKALLFDRKNRLLVTTDTLKSAIYSVNTTTGSASVVNITSIDNINSIEEDLQGNFYATSWGDSYFYRLDKNFKNAQGLALYSKPTGLFFNKIYDVIVLACSNCNKVEFHKLHMVYINDVDTAVCPGDSFNVNVSLQFKGKGTYNTANVFYVELSDGDGKFSQSIIIGSYKSMEEPSGYRVTLPGNRRFYGSNYKIRIRSTSPAFYSLNEMETMVPYVPVISISARDTVLFCSPSNLTFGVNKDIDSGFVNYLWYESGNKISNSLPLYKNTFTSKTNVKLIKVPVSGKCLVKDSVWLIPSSTIKIPFKDTIKVCENSWINLGGDSIDNCKIEWTSKKYPNVSTKFNPKYLINFNDTFLVKVTSVTGSCSSQKSIFTYAKPRPDYYDVGYKFKTCSVNGWYLQPAYLRGNERNIKFTWYPTLNLSDSDKLYTVFHSYLQGDFSYKFKAIDTVYHCYDSVEYSIRNIEFPDKPVLGANSKGTVIKNYDSRFIYRWYKDNLLIAQSTNDSQFVVPIGNTKWGVYKVIATNADSIDCSDTSDLFTLTDPGSVLKISNNILIVYPNPANDKLFIKDFNGKIEKAEATIYDFIGQKVLIQNPSANGEINISNLLPGVYSIRVNFENELFNSIFIKH